MECCGLIESDCVVGTTGMSDIQAGEFISAELAIYISKKLVSNFNAQGEGLLSYLCSDGFP